MRSIARESSLERLLNSVARSVYDRTHLKPATQRNGSVFPSQYPELNAMLAPGGGFPSGRLSEIFGAESTGKTTLVLGIIAQAMTQGQVAAYIDVERKLDWTYATRLGINMDHLLVFEPSTAEDTAALTDALLRVGDVELLAVDSVAALLPKGEYLNGIDAPPADFGGLVGRWVRQTAVLASLSNTCVLLTNQLRQKVGTLFGNPMTTPGGCGLKHHCSLRIEMKRIQAIKKDDVVIGSTVRATLVKNCVGSYTGSTEFDMITCSTEDHPLSRPKTLATGR